MSRRCRNGSPALTAREIPLSTIGTCHSHVRALARAEGRPRMATSCHPRFSPFELQIDEVTDITLPSLSGLCKLKITVTAWKTIPLVEQVPQIVKQSCGVTSLHLSGHYTGFGVSSDVWTILRESTHLHIKDINAQYTLELLEYMDSCSGIEKLALHCLEHGGLHRFFHRVFPEPSPWHITHRVVLPRQLGVPWEL